MWDLSHLMKNLAINHSWEVIFSFQLLFFSSSYFQWNALYLLVLNILAYIISIICAWVFSHIHFFLSLMNRRRTTDKKWRRKRRKSLAQKMESEFLHKKGKLRQGSFRKKMLYRVKKINKFILIAQNYIYFLERFFT